MSGTSNLTKVPLNSGHTCSACVFFKEFFISGALLGCGGGTKALRKVPAPQVLFKRTWEFEYLDLMTRRLFLFCASLFSLAAQVFNFDSLFSLCVCVPGGVCNWWEFRNFIYTRLEECDFLIYYSPFTIGISGGQPKFRHPLLFSCNATRIYNMNDVIICYWQWFYVPSIDTQILKHCIKWWKKEKVTS